MSETDDDRPDNPGNRKESSTLILGLFFQLPRDSGPLYDVTQVIDTYVYRALKETGNVGMASAASLYQSVVGFVLVVGTQPRRT